LAGLKDWSTRLTQILTLPALYTRRYSERLIVSQIVYRAAYTRVSILRATGSPRQGAIAL